MLRISALLFALCLLGAACTGEDADEDLASEQSEAESGDGTEDGTGDSEPEGPDNDDIAEITGNPGLETDGMPDDVAQALDEIDDIVSIGACESSTVGLAFTAPDGWQCRVLDQATAGLDGFTLFAEGNQLNITLGTPSPFGPPCELLNMCEQATPQVFSANFPDTAAIDIGGTVTIWGNHASSEAELVITKPSALTDEDIALISAVLDSTVAF